MAQRNNGKLPDDAVKVDIEPDNKPGDEENKPTEENPARTSKRVAVILTGAATFASVKLKGQVFKKGEAAEVDETTAAYLLSTGLFKEGEFDGKDPE